MDASACRFERRSRFSKPVILLGREAETPGNRARLKNVVAVVSVRHWRPLFISRE
jgi:hypothetical protein